MNILNTSKKFLKAGVCAIMLITAGQAQAQQVTVDALTRCNFSLANRLK